MGYASLRCQTKKESRRRTLAPVELPEGRWSGREGLVGQGRGLGDHVIDHDPRGVGLGLEQIDPNGVDLLAAGAEPTPISADLAQEHLLEPLAQALGVHDGHVGDRVQLGLTRRVRLLELELVAEALGDVEQLVRGDVRLEVQELALLLEDETNGAELIEVALVALFHDRRQARPPIRRLDHLTQLTISTLHVFEQGLHGKNILFPR